MAGNPGHFTQWSLTNYTNLILSHKEATEHITMDVYVFVQASVFG